MDLSNIAHRGFTGNQLKVLAMISMTVDHIGMLLLPRLVFLRAFGRLALPIYAYMIAEGCRHTRDRRKYFLRLAGLAALCQAVYFVTQRSLYQCILVTFSISVALICAVENVGRKRTKTSAALAALSVLGALLVCEWLPLVWPGFDVDYGFPGVLLPVLVYFGSEKTKYLTGGLILLALRSSPVQWWSLAAVPLLGMYNGKRGDRNIGKLFYWYYPLHLAALHGISLLL